MNAFVRLILSFTAVQWLRKTSSIWLFPFLLLLVVWVGQSEVLAFMSEAYPEPSTKKSLILGISYLVKWGATLLVIVWMVLRSRKHNDASNRPVQATSRSKRISSSRFKSNAIDTEFQNDGFDFLREKKQLESRSEKVLKGKDVNSGGDL